jgi:hypothetical protein
MNDMFLLAVDDGGNAKLGGTSNDQYHPNWIALVSMSWSTPEVPNSISGWAQESALGPNGKMQLFGAVAQGDNLPWTYLDRTGSDGLTLWRALMTDATVDDVQWSGDGRTVTFTLVFTQISFPYRAPGQSVRTSSNGSVIDDSGSGTADPAMQTVG